MPDSCPKCRFYISPDGCACDYIELLRPGNKFSDYRDLALRRFKSEHPAVNECPCPSCFMSRRWSWFEDQRPPVLRVPRGSGDQAQGEKTPAV